VLARPKKYMKTLIVLLVGLFSISTLSAQSWLSEYERILDKYITSDGVKYKKLKSKDEAALNAITTAIGNEKASGSDADQLAYYLNAYNAWMLKKAVDAYPVESLLNTDKEVYKRKDIKVGGKVMSLDILEHEVIREKFEEARIHFALNCASKGCPALDKKAFQGATLDAHLHSLTADFLNSSNGAKQKGNTLHLSQLFDWFAKDFKGASPDGTVIGFVKQYKKVSGSPQISFLDYSWELNED